MFIYWVHQVLMAARGIFSGGIKLLSYGVGALASWPRTESRPPSSGAWGLSHWATGQVPCLTVYRNAYMYSEWHT